MVAFKAPEKGIPFHFEPGELPDPPESLGDRFGEFVPQTGAEANSTDRLPSHEDLLARQPREELTAIERAQGLAEAEKAKRILGFDKK